MAIKRIKVKERFIKFTKKTVISIKIKVKKPARKLDS